MGALFKPGVAERMRRGVTRLGAEDIHDLRAFQERHFGPDSHQADPTGFAWRFEQGPGARDGPPAVWVCRRDGRIVGQQAGLPVRGVVEGRDTDLCWAVDLMVDPDWRLRGVGPGLSDALIAAFSNVCGLNVSEPARQGFRRAGWRDLGPVPRLARLTGALVAGGAVRGSRPATRAVALLTDAAAPVLRALDLTFLPLLRFGTRLEATASLDERAEHVWNRARRHYPVHVRRDLASLRWRFDLSPQAGSYRRYCLLRMDEPIGYAVTRRRNASLVVVDYFCAPDAVRPLFGHCLDLARREGAALLTCLAIPTGVRRRLSSLGFLPLPGPRLMVAPNAAEPALLQMENWFLTDADSDLDHG